MIQLIKISKKDLQYLTLKDIIEADKLFKNPLQEEEWLRELALLKKEFAKEHERHIKWRLKEWGYIKYFHEYNITTGRITLSVPSHNHE